MSPDTFEKVSNSPIKLDWLKLNTQESLSINSTAALEKLSLKSYAPDLLAEEMGRLNSEMSSTYIDTVRIDSLHAFTLDNRLAARYASAIKLANLELPQYELSIDMPKGTEFLLQPGKLAYIVLQLIASSRVTYRNDPFSANEARQAIAFANRFAGNTQAGIQVITNLAILGVTDLSQVIDSNWNIVSEIEQSLDVLSKSQDTIGNYFLLSANLSHQSQLDLSHKLRDLELLTHEPEIEVVRLVAIRNILVSKFQFHTLTLNQLIENKTALIKLADLTIEPGKLLSLDQTERFEFCLQLTQEPTSSYIVKLANYGITVDLSDESLLNGNINSVLTDTIQSLESDPTKKQDLLLKQSFSAGEAILHTQLESVHGERNPQKLKVLALLQFLSAVGIDVDITPDLCTKLLAHIDQVNLPAGIVFDSSFQDFHNTLEKLITTEAHLGRELTSNSLLALKYFFESNPKPHPENMVGMVNYVFNIYQACVVEPAEKLNTAEIPVGELVELYSYILSHPGVERRFHLIYGYRSSYVANLVDWYLVERDWDKVFTFLEKLQERDYLKELYEEDSRSSRTTVTLDYQLYNQIFKQPSITAAEAYITDLRNSKPLPKTYAEIATFGQALSNLDVTTHGELIAEVKNLPDSAQDLLTEMLDCLNTRISKAALVNAVRSNLDFLVKLSSQQLEQLAQLRDISLEINNLKRTYSKFEKMKFSRDDDPEIVLTQRYLEFRLRYYPENHIQPAIAKLESLASDQEFMSLFAYRFEHTQILHLFTLVRRGETNYLDLNVDLDNLVIEIERLYEIHQHHRDTVVQLVQVWKAEFGSIDLSSLDLNQLEYIAINFDTESLTKLIKFVAQRHANARGMSDQMLTNAPLYFAQKERIDQTIKDILKLTLNTTNFEEVLEDLFINPEYDRGNYLQQLLSSDSTPSVAEIITRLGGDINLHPIEPRQRQYMEEMIYLLGKDHNLPLVWRYVYADINDKGSIELKLRTSVAHTAEDLAACLDYLELGINDSKRLSMLGITMFGDILQAESQFTPTQLQRFMKVVTNAHLLGTNTSRWLKEAIAQDSSLAQMVCTEILSAAHPKLSPVELEELNQIFEAVSEDTLQNSSKKRSYLDFVLKATNTIEPIKTIRLMQLASDLITENETQNYNLILFANTLLEKSPTQIKQYVGLLNKISNTPSLEMKRLESVLMAQIITAADPVETFTQIENVFLTNNLPLLGKITRIRKLLLPDTMYDSLLDSEQASPVLRKYLGKHDMRDHIIYRDLLNAQFKSGNRSLLNYVQVLSEAAPLLDKALKADLTEMELAQVSKALRNIQTIVSNSQLDHAGISISFTRLSIEEAREKIKQLRDILHVHPDGDLVVRLAEIFLLPLGVTNYTELKDQLAKVKTAANQRGRDLYNKYADNPAGLLSAGDLVKGTEQIYLRSSFQNGVVDKENLGAFTPGEDSTPGDADVGIVLDSDLSQRIEHTLQVNPAMGYGNILFVIKDRGQFQNTTGISPEKVHIQRGKLELFKIAKVSERHYGVRTGFPSSEIDMIIVKPEIATDERARLDLFFSIVENGWYIPVVDTEGKFLFTPDQYDMMAKSFAGIPEYSDQPYAYSAVDTHSPIYKSISELQQQVESNILEISSVYDQMKTNIADILTSQFNYNLRQDDSISTLGAELKNMGSTSRFTNIPGKGDFDLTLNIDQNHFEQAQQIAEAIAARFGGEQSEINIFWKEDGILFIGIENAVVPPNKVIDFDMTISTKREEHEFSSHVAVSEKLNSIRQGYGESAYQSVIANIVLAKQTLGKYYKKFEYGGFGGIGVETWVLQNGGNFLDACISFYRAANYLKPDGSIGLVSINEFRENYHIFDPGFNTMFLKHDDYSHVLKVEGYLKMREIVAEYLSRLGIKPELKTA